MGIMQLILLLSPVLVAGIIGFWAFQKLYGKMPGGKVRRITEEMVIEFDLLKIHRMAQLGKYPAKMPQIDPTLLAVAIFGTRFELELHIFHLLYKGKRGELKRFSFRKEIRAVNRSIKHSSEWN